MEADFFSVWGVDINTCSIRRMRNLYERLPTMCHVNWDTSDTPEEGRVWDINTYMIANLIDAVNGLDWHFVSANSKHAPRPPKPFRRPKLKREEPKPKKAVWPGKTVVDRQTPSREKT